MDHLEVAVAAVRRRLRAQASLSVALRATPATVAATTIVVVLLKLERAPGWCVGVSCLVALVVLAAVATRAYLRGPSALQAAAKLDRLVGRQGALLAAFELRRGGRSSGRFEALLLKRESEHSPPRRVPRELALRFDGLAYSLPMLGLLALLVGVSISPKSSSLPVQVVVPAAASVRGLSTDESEALAQELEQLEQVLSSEEAAAALAELQELERKLRAGELDAAEALREAARLEAKLATEDEGAGKWLEDELALRGAALEKAGATEELGRALSEGRTADAAEALRKLSERLAQESTPLSQRELEELRESLEEARQVSEITDRAAEEAAARRERLSARRDRLAEKKEAGNASAQEERELAATERQLESLDRQRKREQQTLSELDRQLAEAARELAEAQAESKQKSSEFLDQAARTLQEAGGRKITDEEKRQLLEQMRKMKERLARQQQEPELQKRMEEFQRRARGKKGKGEGGGQPGGAQPAPIPVPGQGSAPGQQPGEGSGSPSGDEPGGAGKERAGAEAGDGHDPNLEGEASALSGDAAQDASAVAQDSGQGQSASETILSAAEEGFVSRGYQKLYTDYETVAEGVMGRESIPAGRRRQVERYFELIRPRAVQDR